MLNRYLFEPIKADLIKKMVFLGGPRQVGKTTLAQSLLKNRRGLYLNWDLEEDRASILKKKWHEKDELIVLDEVHKYPKWKNLIKGIYDTQKNVHKFLITGSARLDVYKKGGDSLVGRYHHWRLHPITLSELPKGITTKEGFLRLMKVGGFPEPFLEADEISARRWRKERYDRILKDDVRDLEDVKNIQLMSLFVDSLKARVGSEIVLSNIAEDLQVSPVTLKRWLEILERMYLVFIVRPLTKNVPRSLQKPPKVYFFDNADVAGDEGARFENLVATHLLKRLHFLEDSFGHRVSLHYVRDKDGREVDFATVIDGKLIDLIEVKWSDRELSKSLRYYVNKLKPQSARQLVAENNRGITVGDIHIENAVEYLATPLPNVSIV